MSWEYHDIGMWEVKTSLMTRVIAAKPQHTEATILFIMQHIVLSLLFIKISSCFPHFSIKAISNRGWFLNPDFLKLHQDSSGTRFQALSITKMQKLNSFSFIGRILNLDHNIFNLYIRVKILDSILNLKI